MPRGSSTKSQGNDVIDTGTKEFQSKRRVVPIKMRASVLVKVIDSTAIDRALMNGHVEPDEHSALVAFANDCHRASMTGPRASDYGRPIGTGAAAEVSQREADARQRVGRAIDFLDRNAGREAREALLRAILSDEDTPAPLVKSAAKVLMKFYMIF